MEYLIYFLQYFCLSRARIKLTCINWDIRIRFFKEPNKLDVVFKFVNILIDQFS